MAVLEIRDLHVTVETDAGPQEILRGVDLTVRAGETHAIMGPNGSGKSTLAYSVAGHPKYTITRGSVTLDGEDVLAMSVDERARAGLFLAMQYPVEVAGVSVSNFLRTAATAVRGEAPKLRLWVKEVKEAMARLSMDPSFAERNVNEGFSGGEKKRNEMFQLAVLQPRLTVAVDIEQIRVREELRQPVRHAVGNQDLRARLDPVAGEVERLERHARGEGRHRIHTQGLQRGAVQSLELLQRVEGRQVSDEQLSRLRSHARQRVRMLQQRIEHEGEGVGHGVDAREERRDR